MKYLKTYEGYRNDLPLDETNRVPMFIWEEFVDKLESLLWSFGKVVRLELHDDFFKDVHNKLFV